MSQWCNHVGQQAGESFAVHLSNQIQASEWTDEFVTSISITALRTNWIMVSCPR